MKFNIVMAIIITLLITAGGYFERGSFGGAEILIVIAGLLIAWGLWKEKQQDKEHYDDPYEPDEPDFGFDGEGDGW